MKMLLLSLLSLVAVNAFADSQLLDTARLYQCGGHVELNRAGNGDLALKFENVNKNYCTGLRFVDVTSGRVIKSYAFQGTSYTLSQSQRDSLSDDCRVQVQLLNAYGSVTDRVDVTLGWWCSVSKPVKKSNPYSYDVSGGGNCKLNVNGSYVRNVDDAFCAPLNGQKKTFVSYEYSNTDKCKIMIDGRFVGHTHDSYCDATH